ncbi:cytochrome P450 [Colletotrichum karsti]|uniref:Cytochrome P450 n=1 Tax=Colletotrichum karsti TaxID=1095194 RepID=A0A9P6LE56_9PEZI|nr:cytochrome P450 [Colletotrichum karsti]KAF9869716.1 cytochrome P450 [Colletotrichum karsti]
MPSISFPVADGISHGLTGKTLLLSLILLPVGYAFARVIYNLFFHPLRHYPGPKLAAATDLFYAHMITTGQPHKRIAALHAQYGPVVRITPTQLSFTDPNAWKDIFGHRKQGQAEHVKDPVFHAPFKGNIIGADRDDHRRFRRLLSHGFSAQAMMNQQPLITQYVDLLVERLRENAAGGTRKLDMVSWYNWCTFDIISDLAFGEPFGCLQNSDYHPWVSAIFGAVKQNALMGLIGRYALFAPLLKLMIPESVRRKAQEHTDLTHAKVDKRLALGMERPDFIQAMTMKGDLTMNREEMYENAALLIGAGSETTATALSAATFLLTTNPDVLAKLVAEVRGSFATEAEIDFVSVQKLEYMLAVLDETLRMHPPSPVANLRRVCDGGDVICGKFVPHGTSIGVWHYATFRDPKNFALCDEFIPERWLGDPRFVDDKRDALQPFSYGPRNCIGKNLAYVEMRIILARVLWNFDMTLAEDSKKWFDEEEVYTLWLKGDLNVYLKPRKVDA